MNTRTSPIVPFLIAAGLFLLPSFAAAQGILIPRDESLRPLALSEHEVRFEVTDNAAVTHVTQVFRNETGRPLEATYYFAVPPGAVTTDFALWMNGERVRGEVLRRDQARQIYESIVRRTRDPGLLEYVDGELFQASIFPVPAHGEQKVEIEFANVLPRQGNALYYRYPIHESAGRSIPSLNISGVIQSSHRIASLYSPYHPIDEQIQSGGRSARVSMEQSNASASRDFELFIGQTGQDLGFTLLTHDGGNGDGYFMMTLAPTEELEQMEVLPKQVTLVIDVSGSMAGAKMEQARTMLHRAVEALANVDMFQIISFSSGVRAAFEAPVPADANHRSQARQFIDQLVARGNTNISGALERALEDPSSPDRPHAIIFITDGLPNEGHRDVESIVQIAHRGVADGDRRIFAFGVGYDVNTRLLNSMARRGRGEVGYVRPNEDISDVIGDFLAGISAPILTQLSIDFGRVQTHDIYPSPLPDLYRSRDVVIFGRYRNDRSSTVRISGEALGMSWEQRFEANFGSGGAADTSFIANLWANRRVADLLSAIEDTGESQAQIDEIVALATEWGIVTPYTSYLAVDPSEQIRPPEPRPIVCCGPPPRHPFPGPGPAPAPRAMNGRPQAPMLQAEAAPASGSYGGGSGFATGGVRRDTGAQAVEDSIARSEAQSRTRVQEASTTSRRVSGRNFDLQNGVWVERSTADRTVAQRISWGSEEYFALIRNHASLREILALGEKVRFEHQGRVVEIVP